MSNRMTKRQSELCTVILQHPDDWPERADAELHPFWRRSLHALIKKGLVPRELSLFNLLYYWRKARDEGRL